MKTDSKMYTFHTIVQKVLAQGTFKPTARICVGLYLTQSINESKWQRLKAKKRYLDDLDINNRQSKNIK